MDDLLDFRLNACYNTKVATIIYIKFINKKKTIM